MSSRCEMVILMWRWAYGETLWSRRRLLGFDQTISPTSARHEDGLGFIRTWATPPRRLVFWDGVPGPYSIWIWTLAFLLLLDLKWWNRLQGDLLALPSEHVDISLASMGSIDIVLSWSPQKYVTCIHTDNITSNEIFIKLANWNRNMTKIRYLDRRASFNPPNIVMVRVWLHF